jgi:hypothetical protein
VYHCNGPTPSKQVLYLSTVALYIARSINGPLPVCTYWTLESKAGREHNRNALVLGILKPIELSSVDMHCLREVEIMSHVGSFGLSWMGHVISGYCVSAETIRGSYLQKGCYLMSEYSTV